MAVGAVVLVAVLVAVGGTGDGVALGGCDVCVGDRVDVAATVAATVGAVVGALVVAWGPVGDGSGCRAATVWLARAALVARQDATVGVMVGVLVRVGGADVSVAVGGRGVVVMYWVGTSVNVGAAGAPVARISVYLPVSLVVSRPKRVARMMYVPSKGR